MYLILGSYISVLFVTSPTPSIVMGLNKLWDVSEHASCYLHQPGMIELIVTGSCTCGSTLYAQPGCCQPLQVVW